MLFDNMLRLTPFSDLGEGHSKRVVIHVHCVRDGWFAKSLGLPVDVQKGIFEAFSLTSTGESAREKVNPAGYGCVRASELLLELVLSVKNRMFLFSQPAVCTIKSFLQISNANLFLP
jgi:hypothetical protein